jgi:two-component system chemotaxis sensor kinase CheA
MMQTLLAYLVLPGEVSQFEREYLARMNRIGLWFFALHVPALSVLAFFNGQSPVLAVVLTSLLVLGPILAMRSLQNPRSVSLVYGFTSMLMGGLLVHFGQGPVQIEMHFYFFALLAMLAVYANPMAIVVAAVTVAVHHLALWMYLPKSVFNYAAPFWVVLVHAGFVVAESVATCFIARSFFDNVIGLDKIVQARTRQLDARNSDMRLVLDHVNQGFFTIDRGMAMSSEQSRVLGEWFGSTEPNMPFSAYLDRAAPGFAERFSMAWDAVIEDVLPLALTLDQLPKRVDVGLKHFGLEYTPIMENAALAKVLVMISDITADVERERLEAEQRDVLNILRRVAVDRLGVVEFLAEANDLMTLVRDPKVVDTVTLKRAIHTLKGNAMIFGVQSIAEPCHALESKLDEGEALTLDERTQLGQGWARLCGGVEQLLGTQEKRRLEIDDEQYEAIMHAVLRGEAREKVVAMITEWKLEPMTARLNRVAEQAQGIAKRLNREDLTVEIEDNGVRLDPKAWAPFWSAFVHAVRNAIDHGIEPGDQRSALGKPTGGRIKLRTRVDADAFVVEIEDDGRGIDWEAVARKAASHGLPHGTAVELTEALFADGLSTRSEITAYSGRGVGLGVLRAACLERGGDLRVRTEPGRGTCMEFRFPLALVRRRDSLRVAS